MRHLARPGTARNLAPALHAISSSFLLTALVGLPSAAQLVSTGSEIWRREAPPTALSGLGAPFDEVGRALTSGDFDGNGFDDLAIGGEGLVHVVYTTAAGLDPAQQQLLNDPNGFGDVLVAGDFDGDGFDDLAVTGFGTLVPGGRVTVIYGAAGGLDSARTQIWSQASSGIADLPESGDFFGEALAAGDFDGDTFDDLAIGVPGEGVFGAMEAGAIHVLYGSAAGLGASGSQFFSRGDTVPPVLQPGDQFGSSLAAGDFDGDGFDELAIGLPFDSTFAFEGGSVVVFFGSGSGLVTSKPPPPGGLPNGFNLTQLALGETVEAKDQFGHALVVGDFDGDGLDDLAISAPCEERSGAMLAGVAHVLYGTSDGLTPSAAQLLVNPDANDLMGWSLVAGDFDGSGHDDLALGSIGKQIGAALEAGAVRVVYGSDSGLTLDGVQLWHQDSPGVGDLAEAGDELGTALAAGRFGGGGADLAIGVPAEDMHVGQVHVLFGLAPPIAEFAFEPAAPEVGEPVAFTDSSANQPTSWSWAFGDGGVATAQDPSHTYLTPGDYIVTLTASNAAGNSTVSRAITVGAAPSPATVRFASAATSAVEGDTAVVRVLKEGNDAAAVTVAITGGTASAGLDYVPPASTRLSWAQGDTGDRLLSIVLVDDSVPELPETIQLALTDHSTATLGVPNVASVVVADDDFTVPGEIAIGAALAPAEPVVADDGQGRRAVIWTEEGATPSLRGQLLSATGAPLGGPFTVSDTPAAQGTPAAAWTGTGELLVAWRETPAPAQRFDDATLPRGSATAARGAATVGASIVARRFTSQGAPAGPPVSVTNEADADGAEPDIDANGEGGGVVTWKENDRPRGRRLRPDDQPEGEAFDLAAGDLGDEVQVAVAPSGEMVAVWRSQGTPGAAVAAGIQGRQFGRGGTPRGPAFPITTDPTADAPVVAIDSEGGFVIAWQSGASGSRRIEGRRFERDGTAVGSSPFRIDTSAGEHRRPRIDRNAAGDVFVAWESTPPAPATVAGANQSGAAALAVEGPSILGRFFTAGEPTGEQVVIAESDGELDAVEPDVSLGDDDGATVVFTRRRRATGETTGLAQATVRPALARGQCGPEQSELCLQRERFGVRVTWNATDARTGDGQPVPLTADTGYFWFFNPDNVEIVIKVLDGCAINGRYWVFASGLTDIGTTLVVDDTRTGTSRQYLSRAGSAFQPILDTDAFATCP